ncbi:MAG: acyltransferase family protein [Candidatus Limnocylindrales bacterium]
MQAADGSHGETFRPDLEGLRGLAILLVLAFHASVPGITGGYIGVDVFFVLSGFLITGLLLRERERTGRIDLPAFYARRARRILPAAAVVLIGTLVAASIVMAPLDIPRVAGDAMAAAISAANLRFAATSMDYFAAGTSPSPFLHYWSLGVEEQFYLVWPALLIVAMHLGRPRLGAGLALVLLTAVSLLGALWLTDLAAPWAFYSLPARAWQLGLGGLLAVGVGSGTRFSVWAGGWVAGQRGRGVRASIWVARQLRMPSVARAVVGVVLVLAGWAGLAAIVAATLLFDGSTPYPGSAALLPTLGAGALILSGMRRFSPAALLVVAPMRWFGRISYSLYLVHWPILVLPAALLPLDQTLPLAATLGLAGVAIVLAAGLHRWVEEPFHRGRRFELPHVRVLETAGATMAAMVLLAAGVGAASSSLLDAASSVPIDAQIGATTEPTTLDLSGLGGDASVIGGAGDLTGSSVDGDGLPGNPQPSSSPGVSTPGATATTKPTAAPTARPVAGSVAPRGPLPLPANVRPSLVNAPNDWERLLRDGCLIQELQVTPANCVYGNVHGTVTVALVGDSHASQWFPALERVALAKGWRLVPLVKLSCRFVDLPEYSRVLQREYTECAAWRPLVIKRLQALKPDLTIVSAAEGMQPMVPSDDSPTVQGQAMARLLRQIPGRIAILVDTPEPDSHVPDCLSRNLRDVTQCATPRATAYTWRHRTLEVTAAKATGASVVDLSSAICPYDPCPAVYNGMIVYRDNFHLTATFAASLAAPLYAALPRIGPAALATPTPMPSAPPVPTPTPPTAPGPIRAMADPRARPLPI